MNPKRGAVPFPLAGKGAYLRFDLDALATLESELGEEWWMGTILALDRGTLGEQVPAKTVKRLLDLGLFDLGGGLMGSAGIGEQPVKVTYAPLRDALAQAINGTSYGDMVDEIRKRAENAEAEAKAAEVNAGLNGGSAPPNPPSQKPEAHSTG